MLDGRRCMAGAGGDDVALPRIGDRGEEEWGKLTQMLGSDQQRHMSC